MMVYICNLAFGRLNQDCHKIEASLGYMKRPSQNTNCFIMDSIRVGISVSHHYHLSHSLASLLGASKTAQSVGCLPPSTAAPGGLAGGTPPVSGGSGGCWHLATRDPRKAFQCWRLETPHSITGSKSSVAVAGATEGPFSKVLGLCSLPLFCRILGVNRGLLVEHGVGGTEHAPRGAGKIYGAGFLLAGERPRAGAMEAARSNTCIKPP